MLHLLMLLHGFTLLLGHAQQATTHILCGGVGVVCP